MTPASGSVPVFDGAGAYVEIPSSADFSVATTGALTVAAWLRPDTLTFPSSEGSGYVYWLGKGESGAHEWALRMYDEQNSETPPRPNRISFYVFNPAGGKGVGSYFQDPVEPGAWVHVVGVADGTQVSMYKDGTFRHSETYAGTITPQAGAAPVRIGTRDFTSWFQGAIRDVAIWNRALSAAEIGDLYAGGMLPASGLVGSYPLAHDPVPDASGNHPGEAFGVAWSTLG